MTRGPMPRKAIDEAGKRIVRRGPVLVTSTMKGFPGDLLLFTETQVVFIRVKRIRTHASEPREIERLFRDAIIELRKVPLHPAVCREIHVLAPWGAWQYFRIETDGVSEVHSDGSLVLQPHTDPAIVKAGTGTEKTAMVPPVGISHS
jgi:hypothetical protein